MSINPDKITISSWLPANEGTLIGIFDEEGVAVPPTNITDTQLFQKQGMVIFEQIINEIERQEAINQIPYLEENKIEGLIGLEGIFSLPPEFDHNNLDTLDFESLLSTLEAAIRQNPEMEYRKTVKIPDFQIGDKLLSKLLMEAFEKQINDDSALSEITELISDLSERKPILKYWFDASKVTTIYLYPNLPEEKTNFPDANLYLATQHLN